MLYHIVFNISQAEVIQAVFISTLFVVLLIVKEIRDERKRA